MDQFVTTYRKDFLWPYIRSFGLKPDHGPSHTGGYGGDHDAMCSCTCHRETGDDHMLGPNIYDQEAFQKSGPSLPLMDPKLYPARVGPAPESDNQRFNQPNVFLEKLKMKYPFLYEILRTASPDDIITKINKDRLRTTYQVDFCKMNEYPSGPYDDLLRAAGLKGTGICSEPTRLPGDPCRPNQNNVSFRAAATSKGPLGGTNEKCGGSGFGGSGGSGGAFGGGPNGSTIGAIVSMGSSEYQDAISKLGELIIRDKIHYRRNN